MQFNPKRLDLAGFLKEHRRMARVARKLRTKGLNLSDSDRRAMYLGEAAHAADMASQLRECVMLEGQMRADELSGRVASDDTRP